MNLPPPFLVALQFLTVLPIKLKSLPDPESNGKSLLYYPLVGLLIGIPLALLAILFESAPTPLAAILLLSFWVLSTGALHLDGLADSADAL
ncbi:MAG: adenosylcobinamide-GDP ribazoletransferase, partial [Gammaproteobacteria bacterium]|nr:adenosylcobinamide-GDP ribazoletransferase [Gammaproteobacteria bacterium]